MNNDILKVTAAYLHAAHGRREQHEIARLMGISQASVCRLLMAAKKEGYYSDGEPVFHHKMIDPRMLEDICSRFEDDPLRGRLKLKYLRIVADGEPEEILSRMAVAVREVIAGTKPGAIGVAWGRTLKRIIQRLGHSPEAIGNGAIQCLPVNGEPVYQALGGAERFSASLLAQEFGHALNATPPEKAGAPGIPGYSLVGVPAYVPPEKLKGLLPWLNDLPGYRNLFGKSGAARAVSALITSVGNAGPSNEPVSDLIRERIEQGHIEEKQISRVAYGDIAGLVIARKGHESWEKKLNKGWVGLTLEDIRRIATRDPGTIVVAYHPKKARCIIEAARRGLITCLIVDESLADAIRNELKREEYKM